MMWNCAPPLCRSLKHSMNVGLSTKQATEPYSDHLLNRTWNPSELYSDKEIPFRSALRRLHCSLGSQLGIHRKLGLSPLGTVHATVLGHSLISGLPNANAKSKRFSYATSQIATLPPMVAPNRSSTPQIAARYAAFWHAVSQIALASFL